LFGILDFAKVEETGRPAGFMPAVEASPRNQLNLLNQVIRPVSRRSFSLPPGMTRRFLALL
jgi:hypothetical protein